MNLIKLEIGTEFNLPANDHRVITAWNSYNLYSRWAECNPDKSFFDFYDGPPFVSSENLHWGHILVSMIKSTILFYKRMTGYNVSNFQGYDTHGLPIEMAVNKTLSVKTRSDVLKMGVDAYNKTCKEMIKTYSNAWKPIFDSIGRITSSDNYKTMDWTFMESCWWVFKELHIKNLVYRGTKVMPYSWACNTPISNFEASQNYKEVVSNSIYVLFNLNYLNTYAVVWTTTPWTLPANMALCLNGKEKYVILSSPKDDKRYLLSENFTNLFDDTYIVVETMKGVDIKIQYEPLFSCPQTAKHYFSFVCDDYVDCRYGSGIVHLAPGFGDDDHRICQNSVKDGYFSYSTDKYSLIMNIDENGCFSSSPNELELTGLFYKDANKTIITHLQTRKQLLKTENYRHSYPFCWRTDTELIYRAQSSWFIASSKIGSDMLVNNEKINWFPDHVKKGRFGQWLKNNTDWCVSRNRFFGTPIPIWVNEDNENDYIVIGSIEELLTLSGLNKSDVWGNDIDLHSEFVDKIKIVRSGATYKRIDDVFDCWFESGCVPYGQIHYPFENKDKIDLSKEALCDFICEGIDQTRGWFYTLHVIATALFNKPAFKNVLCSGLILASDGKKMSKRLNNFTDPRDIISKYGADAVRLYMLSLSATSAESSRFTEQDILGQSKVIVQWYNAVKFVLEHVKMFSLTNELVKSNSTNEFDCWIISNLHQIQKNIDQAMNKFEMTKYIDNIFDFIENFTNWYLKFNRFRLKGKDGQKDWLDSINTCIYVVNLFNQLSAPVMPFLAETIHNSLLQNNLSTTDNDSVLLTELKNCHILIQDSAFYDFQRVCRIIRAMRTKLKLGSAKIPVKKVKLYSADQLVIANITALSEYMHSEEMNIIDFETHLLSDATIKVKPEQKKCGLIFRSDLNLFKEHLSKLDQQTIKTMQQQSSLEFNINNKNYKLNNDDLVFSSSIDIPLSKTEHIVTEGSYTIVIDSEQDDSVKEKHFIRMIIYHSQRIRKNSGLRPWNRIIFHLTTHNNVLVLSNKAVLEKALGYEVTIDPIQLQPFITHNFPYENDVITISICKLD